MKRSVFLAIASCMMLSTASFAADTIAEIVFDREPQEKGLSFLREHCQAEEVDVGGKKVWAWKFWAGSFPDMLWVHDARFVFTDPAFKNGKMPIIRGEIEYLHTSNTGFEVYADTQKGAVRIADRWGSSKEFRTLPFQCDATFFGARGTVPKGGTFDLQARACNSAIYIRRIRVIGSDLDDSPDFTKLLRICDVSSPEHPIFAFSQGELARFAYTVTNLSHVAFSGQLQVAFETHDGKALAGQTRDVNVAGGKSVALQFQVATKDLPKDVYYMLAKITRKGEQEPCVVREGSFAVGSAGPLRRARPGEFLYGLDMCFGFHGDHPELVRWAKYMGANLLRYGIDRQQEEKYAADILRLRRNGLEVLAITDGSKAREYDRFLAEQSEVDAFVKRFAAKVRPPYWELGNEPDLPFFFPVGIPRYIEGYNRMYDAIKSADPRAKVSNGGIANVPHIKQSGDNTREFFQLLDPKKVDYVAYHAHGRGYKAESGSYRKIVENAEAAGKKELRYSDTETGVSVEGRDAELVQAATCVQKFVFAQEHALPYLVWFRLYFKEEIGYGNLETYREPRPVVLAYRGLVERLRDFKFEKRLDAGSDDVKAFVFRANDGRRTAVCWTDDPKHKTLTLGADAGFTDVTRYDVFGNASALSAVDGSLEVPISFVPVYLEQGKAKSNK